MLTINNPSIFKGLAAAVERRLRKELQVLTDREAGPNHVMLGTNPEDFPGTAQVDMVVKYSGYERLIMVVRYGIIVVMKD